MSAVDDILSQIPMDQLASQLGTDEQTAGAAAQQAIPALLSGLQANAQDPAGAASLESALGNHSSSLIDGGVDLNQVDTEDGQKIVGNIFGEHSEGVAQTLGGGLGGLGGLAGGGGGAGQGDLMRRLLPLLAPIVLSYLAKRFTGGGQAGAGGQDAGGGLLGSILGGLGGGGGTGGGGLGGGTGGGLGDLLGGMLGGGGQRSDQGGSGNPMLDMLGGMLGGGRRS